MAHQLSFFNDKAEMAFVGEVPWHKFGTHVAGAAMTAEQAIKAAHLDWEVLKIPQETKPFFYEGKLIDPIQTSRAALIRADTLAILNDTVSDKYHVVQNQDLFSFLDPVVGNSAAVYHTVGALRGGEKVWILAKLPKDVIVGGKEKVEMYFCAVESRGGETLKLFFTSVRVVCHNTLHQAVGAADLIKNIRHTRSIDEKVKKAREALGMIDKHYQEIESVFNRLAKTPIAPSLAENFFENVFPLGDDIDKNGKQIIYQKQAMKCFNNGIGADLFPGTWWNALQGVTETIDHYPITYRRFSEERFAEYGMTGEGATIKENAYQLAVALS